MADYISREAAETLMCDACKYDCTPDRRASGQSLITADDCYQLRDLYNTPAADVAPVVHAHWVWGETERDRPFCSNCLDDAFWDNDHGFVTESFCPNCGAKMDERSEDNV